MKLLKDDSGEVRAGIFDDNVRLDLGSHNPVNSRIMGTLKSAEREHFPFLNSGLTIIATGLRGSGDRFFISGIRSSMVGKRAINSSDGQRLTR
jgi:hypothetical protein